MNKQLTAANNRMTNTVGEMNAMGLASFNNNRAGLSNRRSIDIEIRKIQNKAMRTIALNLIGAIIVLMGFLKFLQSNTFVHMTSNEGQAKIIKSLGFIMRFILMSAEYIASLAPMMYATIALTLPTATSVVVKDLFTNPTKILQNPKNIERIGYAALAGMSLNALPGGVGQGLTRGSISTVKRALVEMKNMSFMNVRRYMAQANLAGVPVKQVVSKTVNDAIRVALCSVMTILFSNTSSAYGRLKNPQAALLTNRPNNFNIVPRIR